MASTAHPTISSFLNAKNTTLPTISTTISTTTNSTTFPTPTTVSSLIISNTSSTLLNNVIITNWPTSSLAPTVLTLGPSSIQGSRKKLRPKKVTMIDNTTLSPTLQRTNLEVDNNDNLVSKKLSRFTLNFSSNDQHFYASSDNLLVLVKYTAMFVIDAFHSKYNYNERNIDKFDSLTLSIPISRQRSGSASSSKVHITIPFEGVAYFEKEHVPSVAQMSNVIYECFRNEGRISGFLELLHSSNDPFLMVISDVALSLPHEDELQEDPADQSENENMTEIKETGSDFKKLKMSLILGFCAALLTAFMLAAVRFDKNRKKKKRMDRLKEVDSKKPKKLKRMKNMFTSSDITVASDFSLFPKAVTRMVESVKSFNSTNLKGQEEKFARTPNITSFTRWTEQNINTLEAKANRCGRQISKSEI
mmetsp:Transcript_43170/g.101230  ORF Transcript_43170/g.101230 Transcript_43170/m.101230 type:complete len:419 (+) Transcript_43170:649-1905(+)